jgi:NAD(P)-dependent dehydrogenase (short-subunit alcohol dehydrogenase family)
MQSIREYEKYTQYSRTKLMNVMYAFHVARRHGGTAGVQAMALEPGVIQTKLLRYESGFGCRGSERVFLVDI